MWHKGWRDQVWDQLNRHWDLVIIGGGITGAGILREASQAGLSALLLDANDFAFGTSSRSSKLVHGGFRYLRNRQFNVTSESVKERERLLREAEHLVTPLQFIISIRQGDRSPAWEFGLGVMIYDLMASKWQHGRYSPKKLSLVSPQLSQKGLKGG